MFDVYDFNIYVAGCKYLLYVQLKQIYKYVYTYAPKITTSQKIFEN